jgi:hypothetical protein
VDYCLGHSEEQSVPALYKVIMQASYLELPQVPSYHAEFNRSALQSTGCFILDTGPEVFIWVGHKSDSLLRRASIQLAYEMFSLLPRPKWACLTQVIENAEPFWFAHHFYDWSVELEKSNLAKDLRRLSVAEPVHELQVDVNDLYLPRMEAIDAVENNKFLESSNKDLLGMTVSVGEKWSA